MSLISVFLSVTVLLRGEPIPRIDSSTDTSVSFLWLIGLLLVAVLAKLLSPGLFKSQLQFIYSNIELEEKQGNGIAAYIGLLVFGIFSVLSATWLFWSHLSIDTNLGFWACLVIVLFLFLATMLVISTLHTVFFGEGVLLNAHSLDFMYFWSFLGWASFFSLVLAKLIPAAYQNSSFTVIALLLLLLYVLRAVRLQMSLASKEVSNLLLIFCYFCAVEIAPILIVGKVVLNYIK